MFSDTCVVKKYQRRAVATTEIIILSVQDTKIIRTIRYEKKKK
jgi:hypothetical protein